MTKAEFTRACVRSSERTCVHTQSALNTHVYQMITRTARASTHFVTRLYAKLSARITRTQETQHALCTPLVFTPSLRHLPQLYTPK